jgi:CBS domain-containing protein/anti-sigma regulatory factor (Ser/Thr protein kinase)
MQDEVSSLKLQELAYELKVEDAMSSNYVSVTPDDSMKQVRVILKEKRISGLPVLDGDKLLGIISIDNLINCIMDGGIENKVKDSMTRDIRYIYSDEPLIRAISKFENLGYGRFPVVERSTQKLVGILTKGDIIKCLLKKLEIDYHKEEIEEYRASHIFHDITSDKTTVILQYKIKGKDYKHAGEQSGNLKVNLLRLGIPPKITRRIVIASCEAEMNIIIFTDGGELVARVEEDKITVNAVDRGPGIPDIVKAMQPGYSTAPDWVREMGFGAGMGLPNIKNCTEEMKIRSKVGQGTNLEFVVRTIK